MRTRSQAREWESEATTRNREESRARAQKRRGRREVEAAPVSSSPPPPHSALASPNMGSESASSSKPFFVAMGEGAEKVEGFEEVEMGFERGGSSS